jgi:hypothetical protein
MAITSACAVGSFKLATLLQPFPTIVSPLTIIQRTAYPIIHAMPGQVNSSLHILKLTLRHSAHLLPNLTEKDEQGWVLRQLAEGSPFQLQR